MNLNIFFFGGGDKLKHLLSKKIKNSKEDVKGYCIFYCSGWCTGYCTGYCNTTCLGGCNGTLKTPV
jgi:ribosomally synthesized peptide (Cys-rich family)